MCVGSVLRMILSSAPTNPRVPWIAFPSEFVILDGIPKNIWNSRLLPSTISSRFISFTNYYFSYRVIQNLFRLQFLPDSYTVDS